MSFLVGISQLTTVNALDNEHIRIDFKPLYQCIHIYEALECKAELQRNYQEDRKVGSLLEDSSS